MDMEEARRRNLERQNRWRERHKDHLPPRYTDKDKWNQYHRDRYRRLRLKEPPPLGNIFSANCQYYELSDPRDTFPRPRVVAYCRQVDDPLTLRWELKHYTGALWAQWMRDLEQAGSRPVLKRLLGKSLALPSFLAAQLVRLRIREISRAVTGDPSVPPKWLMSRRVGFERPIVRLRSNGRTDYFATLVLASAVAGVCREAMTHYADMNVLDSEQGRWFDG